MSIDKLVNFYWENHVILALTLCVMSLCPVISGPALSENKIVRPENLTKRTRSDAVHGSRLQVDEDCAGDVFAARGLIVVNIDALQLEVGVAVVGAGGVDSVLVGDNFPELERKKENIYISSYNQTIS